MDIKSLFESELRSRSVKFEVDHVSGQYSIESEHGPLKVSLENLERDVRRNGDVSRIGFFVDAVLASGSESNPSSERLFWCFEPSDYAEPPEFRVAVSPKVDRVLVHVSPEGALITWMTKEAILEMGLSESDAFEIGLKNLSRELEKAKIDFNQIDAVRLGMITVRLPFKTALVLSPEFRKTVEPTFGWPLLAVMPDRNFLFFWSARYREFAGRLGAVVVREFLKAPYPLSAEVFEIDDKGVRAIGAFPVPEGKH